VVGGCVGGGGAVVGGGVGATVVGGGCGGAVADAAPDADAIAKKAPIATSRRRRRA
jgi:hypothetical protein